MLLLVLAARRLALSIAGGYGCARRYEAHCRIVRRPGQRYGRNFVEPDSVRTEPDSYRTNSTSY